MKEVLAKAKLPIAIIVIVFIGFLGYNFLMKKDVVTGPLDKTAKDKKESTPGASLLPLLSKVKNVSLDGKVFSHEVYKSLINYGQIIVEEEKQRANPFAPLSLGSSVSSSVENLGFEDEVVSTTSSATR
jgi:hypothetical protein